MNETGQFRKKNGFTMAGNTLVRDNRLSLKAKGLYLLIMSYISLENLDLTKTFLQSKCLERGKAFQSSWDELKKCGYLKIYMMPGKGGRWQSEYDLLEEPVDGAYCFYLSAKGEVTHTNLSKYASKDSCMLSEKDTDKCTLQNGRYAKGRYDKGINADSTNAKGGNNIKLNNNTFNNTLNNIQSINFSSRTTSLGEMSEKEIRNNVKKEMMDNEGIPYSYNLDEFKMKQAIRIATNWYEITDNNLYENLEKHAFDLLVDCLVEMTCDGDIQVYKGSHVTYAKVIDKINECIKADNDLSHFVEETIDDYIKAATVHEIKDKRKYMKSVIWNSFSTYKIKFESNIARIIG